MDVFYSSRKSTQIACLAALCLFGGIGSAPAQMVEAQVKLAPFSTLDTQGYVDQEHHKLSINDIDTGANGETWIVSDQGVFKKEGVAWDYVPSRRTATHVYSSTPGTVSFVGAKRVSVADDGTVWAVASIQDMHPDRIGQNKMAGTLVRVIGGIADVAAGAGRMTDTLVYHAPEGWVRVSGGIADVAAGGGRVWALTVDDVQGPGSGRLLMRGTKEKFVQFYGWPDAFGTPTAVDVNEEGTPFIVTDHGTLYSLHKGWDGTGTCEEGPGVSCGWKRETRCDAPSGPIVCQDNGRIFTDVAVSNSAVWLTGTDAAGKPGTWHFSWYRFSGEDELVRLAGQMKALGADASGNLYAVKQDGSAVYAATTFDYSGDNSLMGALMINAVTRPVLGYLLKFDSDNRPLALRIPRDPLYRDGLNPWNGMTLAFVVHPLENGASVTAETQCVLSYHSRDLEIFSVCLDGTHENMTISLGGVSHTFPVEIAGQKWYGPVDVGRRYVLVMENGTATLTTVTEATQPNGLPIQGGGEVIEVGSFDFFPMEANTTAARLYVGSRDGRANRYRGYAGLVRIWNTGKIDPAAPLLFHYAGNYADSFMVASQNLLLDAPFFDGNQLDREAYEFKKPISLEGIWSRTTSSGDYDTIDFSLPNSTASVGFGINKAEVFRLKYVVNDSIGAAKLEIYRDGEGGLYRTIFEQSDPETYFGWQNPRDNLLAGRDYTGIPQMEPFVLEVLSEDRIRIFNGNNPDETETYQRVGEPSFNDGPKRDLGRPIDTFRGYNILTMSPYLRADAKADADQGDGLIFDLDRRDIFGEVIENRESIPWGVLYAGKDKGGSNNRVRTVESTRELQEDLRAGLGIGAEVPEVVKFSASADFEQSVTNMARSKSMTAVGDLWWAGHALVVDLARIRPSTTFSAVVKDAVGSLGTPRQRGVLRSILREFGTHYANGVVYGCRARFEKTISEEQLSRAVERQWNTEFESEGMVSPGVNLSINGSFGMGAASEFSKTITNEDTTINATGGTVSFDSEEATCGEEPDRAVPIAYDLRPITQVLTPVLFDDPKIYQDLRGALEIELAALLRDNGKWDVVNDVSYAPTVYMLTIDYLEPKELGSTNGVAGTIGIRQVGGAIGDDARDTVIWTAADDAAATPTDLEGTRITVGKGRVITVVPSAGGNPKVSLTASLNGPTSAANLEEIDKLIDFETAPQLPSFSGTATAIGEQCRCLTACPDGYSDENGECRKTCPAEFEARGETMCYGSYSDTFYAVWNESDCNEDAKRAGFDRECRSEGLAYYFPCKKGYRAMPFGTCMAECDAFDLEEYEPVGGVKLGNLTCTRPTTKRTISKPSPQNACPPFTVPSEFCSMVEIGYTVERVTLSP